MCEKDMASNQLTAVTAERNPVTKESQMPTIYAITDEKNDFYKV